MFGLYMAMHFLYDCYIIVEFTYTPTVYIHMYIKHEVALSEHDRLQKVNAYLVASALEAGMSRRENQ